jgi:hypothetical protein
VNPKKSDSAKGGRIRPAHKSLKIDPDAHKNVSLSTEPARPLLFANTTKNSTTVNQKQNYIERLLNGVGTYSGSLNSFTPKVGARMKTESTHILKKEEKGFVPRSTRESFKDNFINREGIRRICYNNGVANAGNMIGNKTAG